MSLPFQEIHGAVHLHTTFSDGGVDIADLIKVSTQVGLDYIVVTDHMTLAAKEKGYEGFHGDTLVVVGYEHNDHRRWNHYLAIGTTTVYPGQQDPQDYINGIKKAGGIGFLAHPEERRHYFAHFPPYPWTAWDVTGYDGIEVWNQMSEWVESLKRWRSYILLLYPRRFLKRARPALLERWDNLNRTRFVGGIGGVDAHTFRFGVGPLALRIFPTKVELKGVRTHLYVPNEWRSASADVARRVVVEALRDGRGFISHFRRGDASGTEIVLYDAEGILILPGKADRIPALPARFKINVPLPSEARLLRNGRIVDNAEGRSISFVVKEKGVYRIEIYRGRNAWIYSNPFPVGTYPF
ncbi:MAG: hypothetical protein GF344_18415 [Chitinivibrionales bacterium]|nr:hypothetical protein [Chitinivibrionales bacterium]MBD3358628.1 hypothetical protein [Chitinivibrionales bacterium]